MSFQEVITGPVKSRFTLVRQQFVILNLWSKLVTQPGEIWMFLYLLFVKNSIEIACQEGHADESKHRCIYQEFEADLE